ncbi:MAG: hypothetical protein HRU35_02935 [Rickettsiaceae bacterium]|nr:hypothetical protein [Rickettsiaceae bacterium]
MLKKKGYYFNHGTKYSWAATGNRTKYKFNDDKKVIKKNDDDNNTEVLEEYSEQTPKTNVTDDYINIKENDDLKTVGDVDNTDSAGETCFCILL